MMSTAPGGPGIAGDPGLWMMHEHDQDGDAGGATLTGFGCRLLGTEPPATRRACPPSPTTAGDSRADPSRTTDYFDPWAPTIPRPGRYQFLSNGQFDVGVTSGGDFTTASNWVGLLSAGPFPTLAPGGSLRVTFALTLGADEIQLRQSSLRPLTCTAAVMRSRSRAWGN